MSKYEPEYAENAARMDEWLLGLLSDPHEDPEAIYNLPSSEAMIMILDLAKVTSSPVSEEESWQFMSDVPQSVWSLVEGIKSRGRPYIWTVRVVVGWLLEMGWPMPEHKPNDEPEDEGVDKESRFWVGERYDAPTIARKLREWAHSDPYNEAGVELIVRLFDGKPLDGPWIVEFGPDENTWLEVATYALEWPAVEDEEMNSALSIAGGLCRSSGTEPGEQYDALSDETLGLALRTIVHAAGRRQFPPNTSSNDARGHLPGPEPTNKT